MFFAETVDNLVETFGVRRIAAIAVAVGALVLLPDANKLYKLCVTLCEQHSIKTKLSLYAPQAVEQLSFLS